MFATSPAVTVNSVPSSIRQVMEPETTYPRCATSHESVPTTCLTDSDHFHPGSKVPRIAVASPRLTTSTFAFGGVRTSSGVSKRFLVGSAINNVLLFYRDGTL